MSTIDISYHTSTIITTTITTTNTATTDSAFQRILIIPLLAITTTFIAYLPRFICIHSIFQHYHNHSNYHSHHIYHHSYSFLFSIIIPAIIFIARLIWPPLSYLVKLMQLSHYEWPIHKKPYQKSTYHNYQKRYRYKIGWLVQQTSQSAHTICKSMMITIITLSIGIHCNCDCHTSPAMSKSDLRGLHTQRTPLSLDHNEAIME